MMKRTSLLIFSWLIVHNVSWAQDQPEELLASFKINQIDQHKELIVLKFETKWYTLCQDLDDTFLNQNLLQRIEFNSQNYCLLNTTPISTEFNDANQTLNLITSSTMMKSSNNLNHHKNLTTQQAPLGAYLNYDLLYRQTSQQNDIQDLNLKKAADLQFKIVDLNGKELPAGSLITAKPNFLDKTPLGKQGLVTLYGLVEGTKYDFNVQLSRSESCSFHYDVSPKQNNDIIIMTCK